MCGCEEKHEGIRCHDAGCTCHETSPSVWVMGSDGSLYSITSERVAQRLAESYEDIAIYFFATLVT